MVTRNELAKAFAEFLDADTEIPSYWTDSDWRYSTPYDIDWYDIEDEFARERELADVGLVSIIEQFGGEGSGDTYYLVFKVVTPTSTQFFRKDAYYSSQEGVVWDGPFVEVFPRQKTITVYEER